MPLAEPKAIAKAEKTWWKAFQRGEDYGLEANVYIACHVLVQKYRASNPEIDAFKRNLGRAVEQAIRVRNSLHCVGRVKVWATNLSLLIELPSGRRLVYWYPRADREEVLDEDTGEIQQRVVISYLRARGSKMIRQRAWPGLFVENVVQAGANDCLREGEIAVDDKWPGIIVLDVHDEVLSEVEPNRISLEDYLATLCTIKPWMRGLPLAAEGWIGPRYGKR